MNKLQAEKPDVIAFNGYANQYKTNPITVRRGEKISDVRAEHRAVEVERVPRDREPRSTAR